MTSTLHFRRFAGSLFVVFLLCAFSCAVCSAQPKQQQSTKSQTGQTEPAQKGESAEKAPFDPTKAKDAGVGMPTPYDKFIALDQVLTKTKVDWPQVFRKVAVDIDPDKFTDKDVAVPMILGVRIADGVMAIKAKDAELLKSVRRTSRSWPKSSASPMRIWDAPGPCAPLRTKANGSKCSWNWAFSSRTS
jgi:hypothetical protein